MQYWTATCLIVYPFCLQIKSHKRVCNMYNYVCYWHNYVQSYVTASHFMRILTPNYKYFHSILLKPYTFYVSALPLIPRHRNHSTTSSEVPMHWWKSDQHSCGNSNQVCPVWYFPPRWQKWIEGQDHGSQTFEWCWRNQHGHPPEVADWKRQAASDLGHPCWGLAWHWARHPR